MIANELILEVEQGRGADPRLDAEILKALGFAAVGDQKWRIEGMTIWSRGRSVTKSLDLAIALFEWKLPEWEWQAGLLPGEEAAYNARVRSCKPPIRTFEGTGSTPARSLVASFLRALREGDNGGSRLAEWGPDRATLMPRW